MRERTNSMLAKMTNVCTKHPLEEHLSHTRDNTEPVAQKKEEPTYYVQDNS